MRILLFAGPTAHGADLTRRPVERHGPVRHGDLLRAGLVAGDRVVIVDGLYQHAPPLRYKEILAVLRRGVQVIGASSMGALRAAEMTGTGMRGVGRVFDWYATGRIEADADVALAHCDADEDYRALTIPVVTIRHAADQLALPAPVASALVECARAMPFSRRTPRGLRAAAAEPDLLTACDAVLEHLRAHPELEVKRADMLAALDVAAGPLDPPSALTGPLADVSAWERQTVLDHTPAVPGGPSRGELLRFCQLFLDDWPRRHRAWVLRTVAATGRNDRWPDEPAARAELAARFAVPDGTDDERRAGVLVRSFRSGPGKFVYADFPAGTVDDAERAELAAFTTRALAATISAHGTDPGFSSDQLAASEVHAVFDALWPEGCTPWTVRDRGFVDEADFARAARPFYVAARAVLRTKGVAA